MSIASIYCNEIRSSFRKYFGNWEPTELMKLGDIGVIENNMFIHIGNLSSMGITNLVVEEQVGVGNKTFSSKDSVSVTFSSKATSEQLNTKAGLKIAFSKGDSLFFNAVDCSVQRFADKIDLGNKILDLYKIRKNWKRNWVVVTDLIISKNTTIAVSESANSSVSLEAKSDLIEQVDMLDAELSLAIVNNNQVGYCVESKRDIIPLIGVCAIKDTWFEPASFNTLTKKQYLPSLRQGGKMMGFIQAETEEFGQIE